ncbi:acyl carrier protein [Sinosporangium album]|uniref:Acyl carrier protein n=1 Tax=Sinosporangium album TaxID=504805 RepID=A0A1G7TGV4_9ACTN|nr:acyl carrier protein [Sinosporangium album]SDG34597.1 acyl carrier protein [Sinosporangium album]
MEIENTIKKIMVAYLLPGAQADRIGLDDSLRHVHGLDSLGVVELRVQCEDLFGIRISDRDFLSENFASVRTVAALVRRLLHEAA